MAAFASRIAAAGRALLGRQERPTRVRSFDAATGSRRGIGMGTFGRVNSEVGAAAALTKRRARYLHANNPLVNNAVENMVAAIVGTGITPTSAHPDPETRAAIDAAFREWSDVVVFDRRADFEQLQANVVRSMIVDGEVFVQILSGPDGPELKQIPAELVDSSLTRPLGNGGSIEQGVELDSEGRVVAFHVMPVSPNSTFETWAPPVRVPAEELLHIMRPLHPGQVRGISWLAPIVVKAADVDALDDATLLGSKIAAMFAGFIVDQTGGTSAEPFDDPEPSLEPGTLTRLPFGTDVKFASPSQAAELGPFLARQMH